MYRLLLLIFFLASGLFLHLLEPTSCPTDATFEVDWNTWSFQYLSDNPGATIESQMEAWNMVMLERGCDEWVSPLGDLIREHGDSGIPVFWYVSD